MFTLIINLCTKAQTIEHVIDTTEGNGGSTSTAIMTQRIKDAAVKYLANAPVPRIALFDCSFGKDINEFKKLNTMGILYVSSLNHDTSEYPIKKVYITTKDGEIELLKLASIKLTVTDATIEEVFGKNRIDYYYVIPYGCTQLSGELTIDWSANRQNFVLCRLPEDVGLDYITSENVLPDAKREINADALTVFMQREYGISITTKTK